LFWSLGYLALRCLLQIVLLRPRAEGLKELEIVLNLTPPTAADRDRPIISSSHDVKRRDRVGGLIHEYSYAA
jgi:hypothetical protein